MRRSQQSGLQIHPNDDVNMGQSSNDVIPTAIHVSSAVSVVYELLPALKHLSQVIEQKSKQVGHVVKTGRTHLMDAMPVTFAQTLGGWQHQIDSAYQGILASIERVYEVAQGGTAVGTGLNTINGFERTINARKLRKIKGQTMPINSGMEKGVPLVMESDLSSDGNNESSDENIESADENIESLDENIREGI